MKKVLSLVLVIAMVLSSMSFAFAGTFEDVTGDYETAVDALSALGVINGYEDGTFRPEKTITRAELAKILVEALGYGNLVAGANSSFADTQGHWANGYVAIAAGTGLVVGYPDGTFQPDKTVTYDEALTMVVRALGYTDAALKGTWPTNYKVKAIDLDLTDDVVMATAAADRGGVAQIIYNALEATLVEINAENEIVKLTTGTGDDEEEVILLSKIAKLNDTYYVFADFADATDKDFAGKFIDLTPYVYQTLEVYLNDNDDVVYIKDSNSLTLAGDATTTTGGIIVEDENDDEYKFYANTSDTKYMLNGEQMNFDSSVSGASVTVVLDAEEDDDVENNLTATGIVAEKVTDTIRVTDEYEEDELKLDGEILPLNDDDDAVDFEKLVVKGDATSLEEIKEDDVLEFYYGKGLVDEDSKLTIVVTRNTVEGKITRIAGDGDVTIDGVVYEESALIEGDAYEVGDNVILYLDQNGDIFSADNTDEVTADDYAVVKEIYNGYKVNNTSTGAVLADAKVKLFTAAGETVTYVFDETQDGDSDITINDLLAITFEDGTIVEGSLVKYNVNSDGEIDLIDLIHPTNADGIITTGNSFNLASDAVIFNLEAENDTEDMDLISADDLGDDIENAAKVVDGAEIIVLIVYGSVSTEDNIYALMTDNNDFALDEDDDKVSEYTAFVDGVKVTYLGKDATPEANTGKSLVGRMVELTLDGGKLESAAYVTTSSSIDFTGTLKADDVRVNTYITVGSSYYYLTDDVVVYVIEADGDIVLGSKSDVRNNNFIAYNFDADDTNDFGVIVVIE
jgi:hypothetical protein